MADITLTPGSVVAGSGATTVWGTAGATIAQGKAVYLDADDNEYKLADCTGATTDACAGFALTASIDSGPIKVLTEGNMTTAAQLTAGESYYLSEAGLIAPVADLLTADYVTFLGVATTTTNLKVKINVSATAHA